MRYRLHVVEGSHQPGFRAENAHVDAAVVVVEEFGNMVIPAEGKPGSI